MWSSLTTLQGSVWGVSTTWWHLWMQCTTAIAREFGVRMLPAHRGAAVRLSPSSRDEHLGFLDMYLCISACLLHLPKVLFVYWYCLYWINAFSSLFVVVTVFAELKKRGGYLFKHCGETWSWVIFFFLTFNEMFVLKKCILRVGTLEQEPNLRGVLMFLVRMRDLNCALPHPTSTPKHQSAVYFEAGCIAVYDTWVISALYWKKRDLCLKLLKSVSGHSPYSACVQRRLFCWRWLMWVCWLVLPAVLATKLLRGAAPPSWFAVVKKKKKGDNEYRQIWCFRINYCMIILSND